MDKLTIVVASLTILCSKAIETKSGYLLTVPQELQIGATERLCVSLYDVNGDVQMLLSLKCPDEQVQTMDPLFLNGEGGCVGLTIPDSFTEMKCQLEVEGFEVGDSAGYRFNGSQEVKLRDNYYITYIQTDKPIYKPGQTVKFRILTVKQDLIPLSDPIKRVVIQDPNSVRMIQWEDLSGDQGMVSLEYPLSTEPVLGDWQITVHTASNHKTSRRFEIRKYVLPKFEILIKPPPFIIVNRKKVKAEICAQYTYKEPVTGTLKVQVCVKRPPHTWSDKQERPCYLFDVEFIGCHSFKIDLDHLQLKSRKFALYPDSKLEIKATVTETATGVSLSAVKEGPKIARQEINLHVPDHNTRFFKPNLPYVGKVLVTRPDGSPERNHQIKVSIDDINFQIQLRSDGQGFVHFNTSSPIPPGIKSLYIQAMDDIERPEYDELEHNLYRAMDGLFVQQWYSPSHSYIHLQGRTRPVECDRHHTTANISFDYTAQYEQPITVQLHYMVLARGNIISSGHINKTLIGRQLIQNPEEDTLKVVGPQGPDPFLPLANADKKDPPQAEDMADSWGSDGLVIDVDHQMSPHARLLVYYVRPDGETIADSMDFQVESCFSNPVSLQFTSETAKPGDNVQLKLKAKPESLCSVSVVDKSVELLGGRNQLTPGQVLDRLARFDLTSSGMGQRHDDYEYCQKNYEGEEENEEDNPAFAFAKAPGPAHPPGPRRDRRLPRSILAPLYSPYVDSITAFKAAGLHVLTNLAVETRPCEKQTYGDGLSRSNVGGPGMPGPDIAEPFTEVDETFIIDKSLDVRDYFPETWLWDLQTVGEYAEKTFSQRLPHTVTEWVGHALCTNMEAGMGVSAITTVRAFQPFFLTVSMPYLAVRGEDVPVVVSVFNYLSDCYSVLLDFHTSEESTKICVCAYEAEPHTFRIKPQTLGVVNIRVMGTGTNDPSCGSSKSSLGVTDTVIKPLTVEAEGEHNEYTYSTYFCPDDSDFKETINIPLPSEGLIEDSVRGYFSVIGDIMGPTLSQLDQLLALPTGCGEQNMVKFAPNIHVLNYLKNTKQASDRIQKQAIKYMETGYQRQLKFMHKSGKNNGAFSVFGEQDDEGSTWLTAFVVKSFSQAKEFIYIDEKVLQTSVDWLLTQQSNTSGCFFENGEVMSKYMQGGLASSITNKDTSLTAYVLVALLERGLDVQNSKMQQAIDCLWTDTADRDVYTLALTTYGLVQARGNNWSLHLEKLLRANITKGDLQFWARPGRENSSGLAVSAEVEMTSYGLLALLSSNQPDVVDTSVPIVRWLTKQRNPKGGFASTQDTVVALQALAKFAELVYDGDRGMDITVEVDHANKRREFSVTSQNSLVFQTFPLLPQPVHVTARGSGCALMQAVFRYNTETDTSVVTESALHIVVTVNPFPETCLKRSIRVCTRYTGEDGSSDMAVVEFKMVTGWKPHIFSLQRLLNDVSLNLERYELDEKSNQVNFYFQKLESRDQCAEFTVLHREDVINTKPALVKVYDYYATDVFATTSYNIPVCEDNAVPTDIDVPAGNTNKQPSPRKSRKQKQKNRP